MKVTEYNGTIKIVTDNIELANAYLKPSYVYSEMGDISVTARIKKEEYENSELKNIIDASIDAAVEKARKENPKIKSQISGAQKVVPEINDDDEETGYVLLKIKNKAKFKTSSGEVKDRNITVVDNKLNPVAEEDYQTLTKGSIVRISATIMPYYVASSKQASISLWLNGLQLVDPKFYSGSSDFDVVESNAPMKSIENLKIDDIFDDIDDLQN